MARIALEDMRFFAHHGFYEEERILGGHYRLDVYIDTDTGGAAADDDLYQTINYETIYLVCAAVMRQPSHLLETVVDELIAQLKHQFGNIHSLRVRLSKLNPPVGGPVGRAYVEDEADFGNSCGRCGKGMVCYGGSSDCWCQKYSLLPVTARKVREQYGNCVCANCLRFYGAQ